MVPLGPLALPFLPLSFPLVLSHPGTVYLHSPFCPTMSVQLVVSRYAPPPTISLPLLIVFPFAPPIPPPPPAYPSFSPAQCLLGQAAAVCSLSAAQFTLADTPLCPTLDWLVFICQLTHVLIALKMQLQSKHAQLPMSTWSIVRAF